MANLTKTSQLFFTFILSVLLASLLVLVTETNTLTTEALGRAKVTATSEDGFLLRFEPAITQFQVITLPASSGISRRPHSLIVLSNPANDEVWYTDPGADKIGRLIYTDTNDYRFKEFDLSAGSRPFDLIENKGFVWFTASRGDWIGRLEISTTNIVSFPLTAGSVPWNIGIGSDDSVWFIEREADKLGRLIVTDTVDYDLIEYSIPEDAVQPQGLAVISDPLLADKVWFGDVGPTQDRLRILDLNRLPSDQFVTVTTLSAPSHIVNLAGDGDGIWFTQLLGNRIYLLFIQTNFRPVPFPVPTANSQPYDLVVAPNGDIWFSERWGQNIGQLLDDTNTFVEYPVPAQLPSVWLQGIALDDQNNIWSAGFVPEQIYLPMIIKG